MIKKIGFVILILIAIMVIAGIFLGDKINEKLNFSQIWDKIRNTKDISIDDTIKPVTNFFDCIKAGNIILESFPRQCITNDGDKYIENIGNELEMSEIIQSNNPRPNQTITSPLNIEGQARGYWFFEGDFSITLKDANDNTLAFGIAQAQGGWMTENFVNYTAQITFKKPDTQTGTLILHKSNPSGLPQNDNQLIIPIIF